MRQIAGVEFETIPASGPTAARLRPGPIERIDEYHHGNFFPSRAKLLRYLEGEHAIHAPSGQRVRAVGLVFAQHANVTLRDTFHLERRLERVRLGLQESNYRVVFGQPQDERPEERLRTDEK